MLIYHLLLVHQGGITDLDGLHRWAGRDQISNHLPVTPHLLARQTSLGSIRRIRIHWCSIVTAAKLVLGDEIVEWVLLVSVSSSSILIMVLVLHARVGCRSGWCWGRHKNHVVGRWQECDWLRPSVADLIHSCLRASAHDFDFSALILTLPLD